MELGNICFGHNNYMDCEVNRDYQDQFINWLSKLGFDGYGFALKDQGRNNNGEYFSFENSTFWIMPYNWNECGCDFPGVNKDCFCSKPNFKWKKKNIEIVWYKYALRDATSNVDLTLELIDEMMTDCFNSLK